MTATTAPHPRDTAQKPQKQPHRKDIQGLRAVAVLSVLLYHAGVPGFEGGYVGVDVFFVISGFLITGLIVREIETTGSLDLKRFWARRIRRLLPATVVLFVGVAAMTVLMLPVTRWLSIAGDTVASAVYLINWRLAERSVDYLAAGEPASPLQHFWSLAIEEQFYIIWPILVVVAWALAGRRRYPINVRTLLGVGLALIIVASLIWSIYLTQQDPGRAYFVTTTRAWELALGALIAVYAPKLRTIPLALKKALGWCGLVGIVLAVLTFSSNTPFPGYHALLPTIGTAAAIVAGGGDGRGSVRVLEPGFMQDIGALSYALYLWHWPAVVAATAIWGEDNSLPWTLGVMVVAGSAVPAWFTYRVVEKPIHTSAYIAKLPRRAYKLAAACTVVSFVAAAAVWLSIPNSDTTNADAPGAQVLGDSPGDSDLGGVVDGPLEFTPAPADASADNADVYDDGCHQDYGSDEPAYCVYGEVGADISLALIGDSHAAHLQPALRQIAESRGWELRTYTKSACLFGAVDVWHPTPEGAYEDCRSWEQNVQQDLRANPVDLVITSSSGGHSAVVGGERVPRPEADAFLADGLTATWRSAQESGASVLVVLDTPWVGGDVPECVAENPDRLSECAVDRTEAVDRSAQAYQTLALQHADSIHSLDLTPWVCPEEMCPAIIGEVLIYRDGHHLTGTYARSLAPILEEELLRILD